MITTDLLTEAGFVKSEPNEDNWHHPQFREVFLYFTDVAGQYQAVCGAHRIKVSTRVELKRFELLMWAIGKHKDDGY